ncbi:hypothetical protein D1007_45265 [Hordeum vulgare]|nr:hypothetical protein D1007_45265 [Hordeum vulgare]
MEALASYLLKKREHYEDVLGGPFLVELVKMLNLPILDIKVCKRKSGSWGVKTQVFGHKKDPGTEDINYMMFNHDCDMGINTIIHDAIAHLSYHHRAELGNHYFGRFGWQKANGPHIILMDEEKMKFSPLLVYNQELVHYVKNLQMDLLDSLFDKEALREDLKVQKLKDVEIKELENQLLELQWRHRKLRANRDDLVQELEKIKHDQKKPTEYEDTHKLA